MELTAHGDNFQGVTLVMEVDTVVQLVRGSEGCKVPCPTEWTKQRTAGQVACLRGIQARSVDTDTEGNSMKTLRQS